MCCLAVLFSFLFLSVSDLLPLSGFLCSFILVVTADHGNAEEMYAEDGSPKTSHTTNLIPLLVAAPSQKVQWLPEVQALAGEHTKPAGGLSDVAPTVLALMGLAVPKEMTGKPMIKLSA